MLGAVFSAVAGFVYKRHKSRKTAILGAIAGAAVMAVFSVPSNYFITYPAYVQFYHMPLEAILGMYQAILPSADSLIKCLVIFNMPFTLVKGLLDAVLCLLIYKPLSPAAGVLPSDEKEALQYWLKRELLHRHLMSGNIDEADYLKQAAGLQRKFLASALAARDTSGLEAVSAACFAEEEAFVEAFLKEAGGKKINVPGQTYFCRYWRKKNEELAREYALSI